VWYFLCVRYSLLNYIECPVSRTPFTVAAVKECPAPMAYGGRSACERANEEGRVIEVFGKR
jgi:hypothetical protein